MKRFLPAAWLTIFALLAGPLTHGRAGEPDGRRVRVAINGWENNLNPFTITLASQPNTVDLLNLVYDTLFWSQAKANPEPWLAEEARPSGDRTRWTIRLRPDVKWHDGRDFSAEDVKFTFEYFKEHADQSGRFGHHVAALPNFERAEVSGPDQVELTFSQAVPGFQSLPGGDLPMLPKHIWEKVDQPLQATNDKPVGTGPFKMALMEPQKRYRLEANPEYFKGRPLVEELELTVSGDPNVAFNDLVAGKLDLVSRTVPPIFVDQLSANPDLKVEKGTRMESVQLNFNSRKEPLTDARLRKAISLSIDNRVLVKSVLGGNGSPGVDSFIHPSSPWAMPGSDHEFDVAKANQILDSSGYSRKDSDGVRRGPGSRRLEFAALFSTLEPQSLQALQLISQMTTAIGVRMDPEPATPAQLRAIRRVAPGATPNFDAYVSALDYHTHTDPDAFYFLFHSPGRGFGAQITGYSNPGFDALIEDAATTVNLAERKRKLHQAQTMFSTDVPALALFYPDGVYAYRPAAYGGWVPDPGHGILTKRSLLEEYAGTGTGRPGGTPIPPAWIFLGGVAALVLGGIGLVLLRRRPRRVAAGVEGLEDEPEPDDELPADVPEEPAAAFQAEVAPGPARVQPDAGGSEDEGAGAPPGPEVPVWPAPDAPAEEPSVLTGAHSQPPEPSLPPWLQGPQELQRPFSAEPGAGSPGAPRPPGSLSLPGTGPKPDDLPPLAGPPKLPERDVRGLPPPLPMPSWEAEPSSASHPAPPSSPLEQNQNEPPYPLEQNQNEPPPAVEQDRFSHPMEQDEPDPADGWGDSSSGAAAREAGSEHARQQQERVLAELSEGEDRVMAQGTEDPARDRPPSGSPGEQEEEA